MHDFLYGLQVGLEDRLFEIALADEAARVYVDCGERLALVDDERAAALQPNLAFEVCVDLGLEVKAFEDRKRLFIELDCRLRVRNEAVNEALDVFIERLAVCDDSLGVVAGEIPDDAQR